VSEALTARQQQFCDELADLLRRYADVAGPVEVDDVDGVLGAAELAGRPPVNAALSEWLLLTAWVDLDTGEPRTTSASAPGMAPHHRIGLVHAWLAEV
jgi:hypothetical protein